MKQRSFLIKPASSLCNLACKYCFYCDIAKNREIYSFGIMSQETMQSLILKSLMDGTTNITYAFQGGEPTLAGIDFFKQFTSFVDRNKTEEQTISYALQTNGYTLNEEWMRIFRKYDFLIGVSMDGWEDNHDVIRLNQNGQKTHQRVMNSIQLLREYEVSYNILTVLTKSLAKHPEKLYCFYQHNQFDHIQLIPCLPKHKHKVHEDPYALTPKLFASFYHKFYMLWQQDYKKGKYMSVTLFDNLIPMFKGIAPNQCGMLGFCQPQFVVEADGSVYPCDFYAFEEYCLGNINVMSIKELSKSKILSDFIEEPKKLSNACATCMFEKLCAGNCKALNSCYFDDKGYCGYQAFLQDHYQDMYKIANNL